MTEPSKTIADDVWTEIAARLAAIEADEDVRILFAAESGSGAFLRPIPTMTSASSTSARSSGISPSTSAGPPTPALNAFIEGEIEAARAALTEPRPTPPPALTGEANALFREMMGQERASGRLGKNISRIAR